ncbi:MAG: hypothetical protein JWO86_5510 [Myxococcaceae bacterium]|nr:hypothetical protein [Myxococcaceae bacterium]
MRQPPRARRARRARHNTLAALLVAASAAVAITVAAPRAAHADDVTASAPGSAPNAAQEHYTAGRENYRLGLFGRALEEFERSIALAPSPNTRLYIARSLRELGRWAEANEQYAATVREAEQRGGRYLATRDAANVELADVKVRLERANANDASGKDAATTPVAPPASTTPPSSGASPAPASAPAASDSASSHRAPTTLTWVSGAVAVAGAASFGVLYGLAGSRFGYLQDNCARVRTSSCDDARTTGKTEEVVAYAALGVAVVAGAITVYSLLRSPSSTAAASSRSPRKVAWPLAF